MIRPSTSESTRSLPREQFLRALVAGDPIVCHGLRRILAREKVAVAGSAENSAAAVRAVESLLPDLVFIDSRLLAGGDLSPIERCRAASPTAAIIVLSLYEQPAYVARAVALGASAYLCRDLSERSLRLAVEAALRRCVLLDRAALSGLGRRRPADGDGQRERPAAGMTPREWEVLGLMAGTLTYRQMARELGISVATVRSHASHVLKKLDLPNRTRAAMWARAHGLVEVPGN